MPVSTNKVLLAGLATLIVAGGALYVNRHNIFISQHETNAARFSEPNFQKDAQAENEAVAIFAGGCFWCVESDFDKVPGVLSTVSGYIGGKTENPTYQDVAAKKTGHFEAVRLTYDPNQVSYAQLVDVFFHSIDPTDVGGQFCDRGSPYLTAIFALNDEQQTIASDIKEAISKTGELPAPIVTPILAATEFYDAESYHQDYYLKNPARYNYYRYSCGRDARVTALWGEEAHRGIEKPKS